MNRALSTVRRPFFFETQRNQGTNENQIRTRWLFAMNRIAVWTANGILIALCCLLIAATVNQFIATAKAPDPSLLEPLASATPKDETPRRDPKLIIEASPFSRIVPGADPSAMDNLPTTKLSLRLLGTLATESVDTSFAAIEETDTNQSHIVKVQDRIKGTATVVSIERKRIVLENAGQREELLLEEAAAAAQNSPLAMEARRAARYGAVRSASAGASLSEQIAQQQGRPIARPAPTSSSNAGQSEPAALLRQAKILPKFEEGNMIGMQINSIQGNSLFAKIGLQNGDVVKEFNGMPITDTKRGLDMLRDFTTATGFDLVVQDPNGNARSIHYEIREGDR